MDLKGVSMSVLLLSAFATLFVMNAQVADAHGCSIIFTKLYLTVENQMEKPATAIKIHCKSKDNDMGEHTLWNGMHTTFSFRRNVFGKTYFWCDVFSNNKWEVFDAFVDKRDFYRCYKDHCDCKWAITSKGPCFWDRTKQTYRFSKNFIHKLLKVCNGLSINGQDLEPFTKIQIRCVLFIFRSFIHKSVHLDPYPKFNFGPFRS
uniref:S-protein homolog n=1 Tax=Kalanchoe fedtschenkoi TaxID=63787 RepID=A0A7N1A2F1_KALFE